MRSAHLTALCTLALMTLAGPPSRAAEVVWRIGTPDGSCREFAHAGRYEGWTQLFRSTTFRIGEDDLAARWPWIQPGPSDAWAGARSHPLTLLFDLPGEPAPAYSLNLAFVAIQSPGGSRYRVEVNGQSGVFSLPPGPGDQILRTLEIDKPYVLRVPLPGSALKRGENRLVLTGMSGSWVLFDSLSLETAESLAKPRLTEVRVTPTALMVRKDGRLRQLVDVTVPAAGALRPDIEVTVGQEKASGASTGLSLGDVSVRLDVPAVEKPTPAVATARAGGQEVSARFTLNPVKRWKLFVAPAAHLDIGYTHRQDEIQRIHSRNTDQAVELCKQYPTFKWNLEGAWAAQHYLATRSDAQKADFLRLAREGRINIEAGHSNLLTGLLSDEEMFRALNYSHELARRYGLKIKSATLTDVPSHVGTVPTVLASCGIRYLSMGINEDRGPILRYGGLHVKSPVWWEGPDGSRVLAMFHPGYGHGGRLIGDLDTLAEVVVGITRGYEGRSDYPYDAIHLHGAFMDNVSLNTGLATAIDAWNRTYEYPKVQLAANYEFFEYMEKHYGSRIPVVKGCGSSYWEDGAGSSARETTLNRRAHEAAVTAESLFALRSLAGESVKRPDERLWDLWNNILLYDEHTWGAYNSISNPESDFVLDQFRVKASFAEAADSASRELLRTAVAGLRPPAPARASRPSSGTLESRFYRLQLDPATGAVVSLYDKEHRRELVDPAAPWKLGQVIYSEGSNNRAIHPDLSQPVPPFRFTAPTCDRVETSAEGLVAHLSHPMFRSLRLVISLPEDRKRVDLRVEMDKKLTYDKEAVYVAFPFQASRPDIRYAVGNGTVHAGKGWLPGACLDWFSIQNWLRVSDGGFDILWSTPDAPLIQLQAINTGKWLRDLPITNGHVYSYALNNYWHTNYKAGQDGRLDFRFSLTSGRKLGDVEAYRFGREVANPLFSLTERYVRVGPSSVALQAAKMAEEGDGVILRLREVSGRSARARVSFTGLRSSVKRAWLCDGVERRISELTVRDGAVEVPMKRYGIATIKVAQ